MVNKTILRQGAKKSNLEKHVDNREKGLGTREVEGDLPVLVLDVHVRPTPQQSSYHLYGGRAMVGMGLHKFTTL